MSLEVGMEERGGDRVIRLSGELDIASVPAFEEALEATDTQNVVVDLRGLTFMDSTGLRAILVAAKSAASSDVGFALVQGPPHVHRVFEITQTADRLTWVND